MRRTSCFQSPHLCLSPQNMPFPGAWLRVTPERNAQHTFAAQRDGLAQSMKLYLFLSQLRDSIVIENWISGVRQAWLNIPQLLKAEWSLRGRFLICKIRMKILVLAHCSVRRMNWNKSPKPLSQLSHTPKPLSTVYTCSCSVVLDSLWPHGL